MKVIVIIIIFRVIFKQVLCVKLINLQSADSSWTPRCEGGGACGIQERFDSVMGGLTLQRELVIFQRVGGLEESEGAAGFIEGRDEVSRSSVRLPSHFPPESRHRRSHPAGPPSLLRLAI